MPPETIRAATEVGLWLLTDSGERMELEDRKVHWLASHAGEHWALVDGNQLWHQPPDGAWDRVATSNALTLRCLQPIRDGVLVGTEEAHLLRHTHEGLKPVASFEFAHGRDDWFTPWGGPPDVRSMAIDANGTVFVNVHVGGILRSADDGTRWEPTIDLDADVHEILVVPDRPIPQRRGWLLAATAGGLAVSTDSGETWSFDRGGLHAAYCRAIGLCGDMILLSASDGPHGQRSALYRRPLDGEGFERCETGLPEWFAGNIDTGCVAGSDSLGVFGTQDGRVFVSEDSGLSWQLAREGLTWVHRVLIGSGPRTSG